MPAPPPLSPAAALVRAADRERFVTALFAPAPAREGLMLLYAFNAETGRVRDAVREPAAGLIRLLWWEEGLAGDGGGHPLLTPLCALIRDRRLSRQSFAAMIEARRRDLDPTPLADLAALEARALAIDGTLAALALAVLGVEDDDQLEAARALSTAWGLIGGLRALGHDLARGRVTLPRSVLESVGIDAADLLAGRASPPALADAARLIGARAGEHLARARAVRRSRAALPGLLPAVLAAGHLATLGRVGWNPLDRRVAIPRTRPWALLWASVRGKV